MVETENQSPLGGTPTAGQRWLGIVLSAVIALFGFAILAVVGYVVVSRGTFISAAIWLAAVGGILLLTGCWFIYRAVYTAPTGASHRARLAFAWLLTIVFAAIVIEGLLTPAEQPGIWRPAAYLAIAIGWLVGELRARKLRSQSQGTIGDGTL